MKKILFGLLLLLTSTLQGQSYLRASSFTMGVRVSEYSPITWGESNECSILIECYTTKVIINSKVQQNYHVINQTYNSVNMNTWLCKDVNGVTCKFTMMKLDEYPGFIICQVDYNDAVWFYVCTQD